MNMKELMAFTRMTGDLVKAMRACRQPVVSAVEGICAGAGAIIAMASDLRYASESAKWHSYLTGSVSQDVTWGRARTPRIIGQGRASELLYFGRSMSGEEGERWGFLTA